MKKLTVILSGILSQAALAVTGVFSVASAETVPQEVYNPPSSKDIFYWILFALLVLATIFICFLFTKSKRFKLKQRVKMMEDQARFKAPDIINVTDEAVEIIARETDDFTEDAQYRQAEELGKAAADEAQGDPSEVTAEDVSASGKDDSSAPTDGDK